MYKYENNNRRSCGLGVNGRRRSCYGKPRLLDAKRLISRHRPEEISRIFGWDISVVCRQIYQTRKPKSYGLFRFQP